MGIAKDIGSAKDLGSALNAARFADAKSGEIRSGDGRFPARSTGLPPGDNHRTEAQGARKDDGGRPASAAERLASCYFYHTMELPELGLVEGGWDLRGRFGDYTGHVEFRGKRVLDVGAASGFLSFEAERHGAREVVSFDLDSAERQHLLPFAGSAYVTDHASWARQQTGVFEKWKNSYRLAHELLRSRAKPIYGDVYAPPPTLGRFDVVICGAIIEHLIDPLSALRALAALTDDLLVINTDYFDTPGPVALFVGRADEPARSFTFWVYSIALYDEYMRIMGFEQVGAHKNSFAATRPAPGEPRPLLDRVALVYRRRARAGEPSRGANPATPPRR